MKYKVLNLAFLILSSNCFAGTGYIKTVFPNGATLKYTPSKKELIYTGPKPVLQKKKLLGYAFADAMIPVNSINDAQENGVSLGREKIQPVIVHESVTLFSAGGSLSKIYLLNQDGKVKFITLDEDFDGSVGKGAQLVLSQGIKYKDHDYVVYSIAAPSGEYRTFSFLLNEDLAFVDLGYATTPLEATQDAGATGQIRFNGLIVDLEKMKPIRGTATQKRQRKLTATENNFNEAKSRVRNRIRSTKAKGVSSAEKKPKSKPKKEKIVENSKSPLSPLKDVKTANQEGESVSALKLIAPFVEDLTKLYFKEPLKGVTVAPHLSDEIYDGFLGAENASVVLLGNPGTGKTTDIRAIASNLANSQGPIEMQRARFIKVDIGSMTAGTKFIGSIEAKVMALKNLSAANPDIIWVIDEIHSLGGKGTHDGDNNDIMQLLKPAIADGKMKILGMTTYDEFVDAFIGDRALYERFAQVFKNPPTNEQIHDMVSKWPTRFGLTPPDALVVDEAIRLSSFYNALGAQPRKTILLFNKVYAIMKRKGKPYSKPTIEDITEASQSLYGAHRDITIEKARAIRSELDKSIVGQDEAKTVVENRLLQVATQTNDPKKPRFVIMLIGEKGQGKTEFTDAFSMAVNGVDATKIPINEATSIDDILRPIFETVSKNPFAVFNIDEIEKAPVRLQNTLLETLARGQFPVQVRLGAAKGTRRQIIDVRKCYFFMTSNAGSQIGQTAPVVGFSQPPPIVRSRRELEAEILSGNISDTLVDRADEIVYFAPLGKDDFKKALNLHLERSLKEMAQKNIFVRVTNVEEFLNNVVEQHYRADLSNREIIRLISRTLRQTLAEAIAQGELKAQPLNPKAEIYETELSYLGDHGSCVHGLSKL